MGRRSPDSFLIKSHLQNQGMNAWEGQAPNPHSLSLGLGYWSKMGDLGDMSLADLGFPPEARDGEWGRGWWSQEPQRVLGTAKENVGQGLSAFCPGGHRETGHQGNRVG